MPRAGGALVTRSNRGLLPMFHPDAINARRGAAGDREAACRYQALAATPEERAERLTQAAESRASARAWLNSIAVRRNDGR